MVVYFIQSTPAEIKRGKSNYTIFFFIPNDVFPARAEYLYIVFIDFHHTKLYHFHSLSRGFILRIFLKFRKFRPRYSSKIYSYIKRSVLRH